MLTKSTTCSGLVFRLGFQVGFSGCIDLIIKWVGEVGEDKAVENVSDDEEAHADPGEEVQQTVVVAVEAAARVSSMRSHPWNDDEYWDDDANFCSENTNTSIWDGWTFVGKDGRRTVSCDRGGDVETN